MDIKTLKQICLYIDFKSLLCDKFYQNYWKYNYFGYFIQQCQMFISNTLLYNHLLCKPCVTKCVHRYASSITWIYTINITKPKKYKKPWKTIWKSSVQYSFKGIQAWRFAVTILNRRRLAKWHNFLYVLL